MINVFRLYDPILQKVRIGNNWDGGYVVALQSLGRSSALFSYGVGTDISFEKAYVDATNREAFCFDHTIENFVVDEPYQNKITYLKEGISGIKTDVTNNFIEHYKERGMTERVLFKADVEGAEIEFILNTDISELARITTGLVFEFHYLQDPTRREETFECLKKLNEHFLLCHVHGNNYANNFVYDEVQPNSYIKSYSVPEVIELTFVNKDLVPYVKVDTKSYPSEFLDRKNELSKPELDLSFLKLI
jgi:hypothetical protein